MYSFSTSFWMSTLYSLAGTPCFSPATMYIASRMWPIAFAVVRHCRTCVIATVLAERPESRAVHGRLDATRVRELTGEAEVALVIQLRHVRRRVHILDL